MKKIGLLVSFLGLITLVSGCSINEAKLVNTQKVVGKSIDYKSDDIIILENETNEVVIKEYLTAKNKSAKANINQNGNELLIESGRRKNMFFQLGFDNHIEVYLPKNYKKNLSIHSTSGSIKINTYFELKELTTKQSSGSLKMSQLKAEEMNLQSTSGSIKINQIESKDITAESSSGSLTVENILGSADLKTTSGSIKASFKSVDDYLNAESTSGSVKIDLPKNLSFNFEGSVNSGSIRTDFDKALKINNNKSSGVVGAGDLKSISLKTTSGSIKVRQD